MQRSLRSTLPKDGVDIILTNPPFGAHIISASTEVIQSFNLARKWAFDKSTGIFGPSEKIQTNVPPQVLFVERCLSLLKPGGRLGMVLPESILSNKSYRNVVEYLLKHTNIEAVMGMPEALFKTSGKGGTHTKTCLLIASKKTLADNISNKTIFMAEAKWCGQDSRARKIPHNDLPDIANNFTLYKQKKLLETSTLGFSINTDSISGGVLCPRYYDPQSSIELDGLNNTHTLISIAQLLNEKAISINTGDEIGKLSYGTGPYPFIRTSDISNWELKADPKHSVSLEIFNSLRIKQDVIAGYILMVKDGTYLIGTCAIVSEADEQILYQSHLYKIRVNENKYDLNPYLLLAILSSSAVQKQIKSKQFTQDIIDSLGERIRELVLPIPTSKQQREKVTELVKKSVKNRIEARELAKQARLSVTE
jgi:type I restriction enzyme M protein